MPVLIQPIPGKAAFGTIQPLLYSSEHLAIKKGKLLTCNRRIPLAKNYGQYYLSLRAKSITSQVNRMNLIYNLYSKENLLGVNTVSENTILKQPVNRINPAYQPYYLYYFNDPKGELFGATPCGVYNWVDYMETTLFLPGKGNYGNSLETTINTNADLLETL